MFGIGCRRVRRLIGTGCRRVRKPVVSRHNRRVPCWDMFRTCSEGYRNNLLRASSCLAMEGAPVVDEGRMRSLCFLNKIRTCYNNVWFDVLQVGS
jgi:hypothetical protein